MLGEIEKTKWIEFARALTTEQRKIILGEIGTLALEEELDRRDVNTSRKIEVVYSVIDKYSNVENTLENKQAFLKELKKVL